MTAPRRIVARVSDHALVRYLERVKGFDMAALRAEILTPGVVAAIEAGARTIKLGDVKFPVNDGVICTVLANSQRAKRRDRKQRFVLDRVGL